MKSKYLYFGLDFLRLNFKSSYKNIRFDNYFSGLSANSNFKTVDWFGLTFNCTFTQTGNKKILIFNYNDFPVFVLEEFLDGGINTHTSYVIQFYSAFFYIKELDLFLFAFLNYYGRYCYITRFDIALDVPLSISDFVSKGYSTKFRKGAKFGLNENTGEFETWYLGAKGCSNKKHFIRIYNKLLDSKKKSKMMLFWQYFDFEDVTRIEVQVNSQSCSVFGAIPDNITDINFLGSVFKSCAVNKSGTIFNHLEDLDFINSSSLIAYKKPKKSDIIDKLSYAKTMLGYAQTLLDQGFDPVLFLRDNLKDNQPKYSNDNSSNHVPV